MAIYVVKRRYYYFHDESGSLWSSDNDYEDEPNDGCVEPVSLETAKRLQKELKMDLIPHLTINKTK